MSPDTGPNDIDLLRKVASDFLNGAGVDLEELLALPENLAEVSAFGLGLRVWDELIEKRLIPPEKMQELANTAVLCAYKDPDVPNRDGLDRALQILERYFDLQNTNDPETLGLAGAVHKRKWQQTGKPAELTLSWRYYRSSLMGRDGQRDEAEQRQRIREDQGYNAINVAFVADTLAAAEIAAEEAQAAQGHREEADRIRRLVRDVLADLDLTAFREKDRYWVVATQLEAHFGLGQFKEAFADIEKLQKRDVVPKPEPWMLEATATQLARLVRYRFSDNDKERRKIIGALLGKDGPPTNVESLVVGKVGLALSGGGFRAALYHIGVLARLAERDALRHIDVISTVSGGSIVGAQYYLLLKQKLESRNELSQQDYIDIVREMEEKFLEAVQVDVRSTLYRSLPSRLSELLQPTKVVSEPLADMFEQLFYSAYHPEPATQGPIYLDQMSIFPGGDRTFNPKNDNWSRHSKVPALVINATSLNTGHVWQFTAAYAGESPYAINDRIDSNDRLRRFYYRPKNRRDVGPVAERRVSLGAAVAASACVPGLFPPVDLGERYPGYRVGLVDGGVHDNQGVISLLEQDCTQLIVSDACGQMTTENVPQGVAISPLMRSNSILMERVRQEEYARIEALLDSGRIDGLLFVHLRQDLAGDAVEWVNCEDPRRPLPPSAMLPYGIRREYQQALAGMRTDLDAFSDVEAQALMFSGYRVVDCTYERSLPAVARMSPADTRIDWRFLEVRDLMTEHPVQDPRHQRFRTLLQEGSKQLFRDARNEEGEVLGYLKGRAAGLQSRLILLSAILVVVPVIVAFLFGALAGLSTFVGLLVAFGAGGFLTYRRRYKQIKRTLEAAGLDSPRESLSALGYAGVLWAVKQYSTFHLDRYKQKVLDRATVASLANPPADEPGSR